MEHVIGRSSMNAYLPVTTHHQVASGAEVTFAIREQINILGSHIHIQDGRVERYPHIGDRRPRPRVRHSHLEAVGTGGIRIDVERDCQFAISCLCRRMKWRSGSS